MTEALSRDHLVTSVEQLERIYGEPYGPSIAKEADRITAHYRAFIEAAPFFALASGGPGRARLLAARRSRRASCASHDEKTLLIPDRRGNNRIDSLRNILQRPARRAAVPHSRLRRDHPRQRPRRDLGRSGAGAELRRERQGAARGARRRGRARLLPVRQGDRALEAVGRLAPGRPQEPAERRHDPRRAHRRQARRRGARPRRARAAQGDASY